MTQQEKKELKTSIEKKIKNTEAAIEDYKEMTKPVAWSNPIPNFTERKLNNTPPKDLPIINPAEMTLDYVSGVIEYFKVTFHYVAYKELYGPIAHH